MPPKELVDEIDKAYNEYKKEKEKEVDYLTFYNGFVACNRNRQQENNKLLDVINNQDIKIADLEKQIEQIEKVSDYNADQLTKATKIIKNLLILKNDHYGNTKMEWRVEITEQAEQFIKEIEK